jgi:hypothetical protein
MDARTLTEPDFTRRGDPFALFSEWLDHATRTEPNDPNALALATVDAQGMPNVRMVLLKGHGENGFIFFTNFESAKGTEILATGKAAMCFHWKSLRRQVRLRGPVEVVEPAECRSSRGRWPPAPSLRPPSRPSGPVGAKARSPVPVTGAASASRPKASSSGRRARIACTTAWCSGVRGMGGRG